MCSTGVGSNVRPHRERGQRLGGLAKGGGEIRDPGGREVRRAAIGGPGRECNRLVTSTEGVTLVTEWRLLLGPAVGHV